MKILQERDFGSPHGKCWLHPVNCIKSLLDRWQTASIELTRDDSSDNSDVSFPSSKRARLDCKSQEDIHHKLDEMGVPVCRSWWPLWATWSRHLNVLCARAQYQSPQWLSAVVTLWDVKGALIVGYKIMPRVLTAPLWCQEVSCLRAGWGASWSEG